MLRWPAILLATSCLVVMSGCLLKHSKLTVIRQGEPLYPVSFQSEQSRLAFESHVAMNRNQNESSSSLTVPFILGLSTAKRTSDSAIRNDAAVQFDVNRDGIISDAEMSLLQD